MKLLNNYDAPHGSDTLCSLAFGDKQLTIRNNVRNFAGIGLTLVGHRVKELNEAGLRIVPHNRPSRALGSILKLTRSGVGAVIRVRNPFLLFAVVVQRSAASAYKQGHQYQVSHKDNLTWQP